MLIRKQTIALSVAVILMAAISAGCTIKFSELRPNSHFAYPNSNVEPLGAVSAETSRTTVFVASTITKEMMDEVITKALKQKGADMLLNYKLTTEVTMYPLVVLPISIFTTTLRLEGTAAKQTIGKQELK